MIYIDLETGTYGDARNLVLVENPTPEFCEELYELDNDDDIMDMGNQYGTPLDELLIDG